jgi:tetratricopeptide (TPR) repeat protein
VFVAIVVRWVTLLSCGAMYAVILPTASQAQSHYERPNTKGGPFKKRVVVFVHGIFGDADGTWRYSPSVYWPQLLLTDDAFRDSDIYVASYSSPYLGNTMNLNEVVTNLNNRLVSDEVFSKHSEVVFVCHSLGGLVVQQLLLTFRDYSRQVPFIYFFSTPQTGAEIANLARVFSSDPLLRALIPGDENDYLQNLENQWKAAQFHIHRFCAYEKRKYKGVLVVERLSGTRNCDDPPIAINEDHIGIVKPNGKEHDSYIALRNAFIQYPVAIPKPSAHGTVKGVILANDLGGSPVARVKVSAVGANPIESGENGNFTLQFPGKQPGETIQVIINRPGYQVVNWFDLKVTLPRNPDAQTLTLLICKEEEFEEWARRFYRLKSDESSEATYKRRLHELEETNEAAMAKLRQERDQAMAAAETASNESALTVGETTDLYKQAMALFSKGMVQEALHILDDGALDLSMEAAQQKTIEAEKAIAEAVQNYFLKAQLLTTQFRFDEAEGVYKAAVERAPEIARTHFALAAFSQVLNRSDEARTQYLKALEIARRNDDDYAIGTVLNNLGGLDLVQNRMREARGHLEEALKMRRQVAQRMPSRQVDVALTLNTLALLEGAENHPQEAHQYYAEAVEIFEQQAGQDPTILAILATTLSNLGSLNHEMRRMEESKQCYETALKIYRQPPLERSVSLLLVATTLNNLGGLEKDLNRVQEARQHYEDALGICRQVTRRSDAYVPAAIIMLLQQSPDSGQTEALILTGLANLDIAQNRMEEARQHLDQALRISRQLAQGQDAFSLDVARTLVNLGGLDYQQNRLQEARQHDEEGLTILRQVSQSSRVETMSTLGIALGNLGAVDAIQNRMEEARQHDEEALKIRRQLAEQNPDRYLPDVATTLNNLGNLKRVADPIQARQHYEDALEIYRRALRRNPDTCLPDLALVLINLGGLDGNQKKLDDARQHFEEALKIWRQLAQRNPEGYLPLVVHTLLDLERLDRLQGQPQEARQHHEEALTIQRQLAH